MQINRFNFIRWYSNEYKEQTIRIPRLGVRQDRVYMPVIAVGEAFAFYINADQPFTDSDNSLTLGLVGEGGTVISGVSALTKDVLPDDAGYNIYCNGTLTGVPAGQYQFVIRNGETVKCISNPVLVSSLAMAGKHTVPIKYRNSRDMYRFRFEDNEDFYTKIRIALTLTDWTAEGNFQQYREVSTGKLRNEKYELDRKVKINTYFFDDGAHEAMTILCAMDDIEINGVKYISKGIYNPAIRGNSDVSKGEAELYDREFSKINMYG